MTQGEEENKTSKEKTQPGSMPRNAWHVEEKMSTDELRQDHAQETLLRIKSKCYV